MIGVALIIVAVAFFIDLVIKDGTGTATIFHGSRVSVEENRYAITRELLDEIDSLREEKLEEDLTDAEIKTLNEKIMSREALLQKL